jgi:hypothetical protein
VSKVGCPIRVLPEALRSIMLHHSPSQVLFVRIAAPPDLSSGLRPILVRWGWASRLVGSPGLPHRTWEVRHLIFPLPHSPRRGSLARLTPLTPTPDSRG